MVQIKEGQTQTVAQLFAIGQSVLAEAKAKKSRAEITKQNDDLIAEYVRVHKPATKTALGALIMADGHTDPKWKQADGKHIGYQKAIAAGSVGAAGYNAFKSWCDKWFTETLVKKTPEDLKAEKEEKAGAGKAVKEAAEKADLMVEAPTAILIAELRRRSEAGDAEAKAFFEQL